MQVLPRSNLDEIFPPNLDDIFEVLGLSADERRVVYAASGNSLSLSALVRRADLPRSTVSDIVSRLEKRHIIDRCPAIIGKNPRWRSNVRLLIRTLGELAWIRTPHAW